MPALRRVRHRLQDARGRACVLWRETSPQDFPTRTGAFFGMVNRYSGWYLGAAKGGQCVSHARRASPWDSPLGTATAVHATLEDAGIPIVRVWGLSRAHSHLHLGIRTPHTIHKGENGSADCTHYCTPGPIDLWVAPLLHTIRSSCLTPERLRQIEAGESYALRKGELVTYHDYVPHEP
jgi:hypothetical protein